MDLEEKKLIELDSFLAISKKYESSFVALMRSILCGSGSGQKIGTYLSFMNSNPIFS